MIEEFEWIGKDMFSSGLIDSHSGNLSIRKENKILITKRGVKLGHLRQEDLIEVDLEGEKEEDKLASIELPVHRAIYRATPHLAIIHAHPSHAIALSLTEAKIIPVDAEGLYLFKSAPVVKVRETMGSPEVVKLLPPVFAGGYMVAVIKGHGSFAVGKNLEEAYRYTSSLENSCRIIMLSRQVGRPAPVHHPPPPHKGIPPGIGVMGRTYRGRR